MARQSRVADGRAALGRLAITAAIASALLPSCGNGDDENAGAATSATSPSPASVVDTSPTAPQATGLETFPPVGTEAPDEGGGSGGLGLPDGPSGPGEDRNRDVYFALREGKCAYAADSLDRHWGKMRSPRDVLIFQAAIELCRGDRTQASTWLSASTDMGLDGLAVPVPTRNNRGDRVAFAWYCEVYRSVRSVLEGQSRDAFACPEGVPPAWPPGEQDDPRTPEDESTAMDDETTSSTPSPPPTESSTTTPVTSVPASEPASTVPAETAPSVSTDAG